MSGFSPDWLALREPYDLRARNPRVLEAVLTFLNSRSSVYITDLACGTGSTLRALSPRLSARQNWTLIDNDLELLTRATAIPLAKERVVNGLRLDLNHDVTTALEGPIDLVTVSALLDLVSESWVDQFARRLAARSIPFYAALSYDGRTALTPSDPFDAAISDAVNVHQRTDKGFGPALGPAAAAFAIARFKALGYSIVDGASDWTMGPADKAIQTEIMNGWAGAAQETSAVSSTDAAVWLTRRRSALAARQSSLTVGHVDFFATPSVLR